MYQLSESLGAVLARILLFLKLHIDFIFGIFDKFGEKFTEVSRAIRLEKKPFVLVVVLMLVVLVEPVVVVVVLMRLLRQNPKHFRVPFHQPKSLNTALDLGLVFERLHRCCTCGRRSNNKRLLQYQR